MQFDIELYLSDRKELVEKKLTELFPKYDHDSSRLSESMRYSILAGGKRLRPILCLASSEVVGGTLEDALPIACAIEMIHTYSLIHDDLPSMDDDKFRRGKPTNHNVYGEALAILAGDALLTDAFFLIVNEGISNGLKPSLLVEIIKEISIAAGSQGMVGGQAVDLSLEGNRGVTLEMSRKVHSLKTGAMIEASVVAGGRVGGGDDYQLSKLRTYSKSLGLAFQIIDDVLDIEGGKELGKSRGADARKKKATFPGIIGVPMAKDLALKFTREAVSALEEFGDNVRPLRELALYLGGRKY
jgi:geranylgeranyl diphosphate synthase, type II